MPFVNLGMIHMIKAYIMSFAGSLFCVFLIFNFFVLRNDGYDY